MNSIHAMPTKGDIAMLVPIMPTSTQEDEHLQLAKTLWVEGNWVKLMELGDTTENSTHQSELSMYIATAFAQQGDLEKARQYWEQATEGEASVNTNSLQGYRLLLSGVHNSLARAKAVNGELYQGQIHWDKSVGLVITGPQQRLAKQVRAKYQLKQLGLPEGWAEKVFEKNNLPINIPYEMLAELHQQYPIDPAILIGVAESAQRQGLFDEAIRHWQSLASLLQESMPQAYYDRLDEAYQNQKSFPLGTPEEEQLRGEGDKHELLKKLHQTLKPSLYLEIGVQTGKSLLLAECEAIGIDPMPRPNIKLQKNHTLLRMTSDEFFANHAEQYLQKPPDLVFIDGMHLFEYALRDFINVERYAGPNTIVVVDDIFPGHPAQAERVRRTRAWTGDIWKLAVLLEKYRPDLIIKKIDVFPTGLLLIRSLGNNCSKNYIDIMSKKEELNSIPMSHFIHRIGAISPKNFIKSNEDIFNIYQL